MHENDKGVHMKENKINGNNWIGIAERKPKHNGIYYVYTLNCMDNISNILKCRYENGQWQKFTEEFDRIVAWKRIPERKIKNKLEWLKKHHNEIKKAFHYDEIDYKNLNIAETLEECLCEYAWFLWNDFVQYIDGVYVIRTI